MVKPTTCTSCGAPVYMLRHRVTTNVSPINVEPDSKGTIIADLERGTYDVLTVAGVKGFLGELRKSHFATCPNASWHRKKR